ncbi:hypothetical protein [Mycolicibacterium sp.]|uniref:hypothetical protein n=1 Tax=Mycolicibacterium sp. TaxID=2320850 RepID=UPI001A2E9130|nr:hypothetical protein [Mycolicibacterium sp.]MBJ7336508.1 hypothetical protein [Mycolicibacterium sp.]
MFALLSDPRRKRRVLTFYSEEVQRTRGYRQEIDRFEATHKALLAPIIEEGRIGGVFPAADPQAPSHEHSDAAPLSQPDDSV